MKSLTLSSKICDVMAEDAKRAYPSECCGILFGQGGKIIRVLPVRNTVLSQRNRTHFQIDPLLVYQAEHEAAKEGLMILGIYHSHPDNPALLSPEDIAYMIPGMIYIILSIEDGSDKELRGYTKEPDSEDPVQIMIEKEVT